MLTFTDLYLMEMARVAHKMGEDDQQYMDSTKADLAAKAKKCRSTNTPFVVTLKPGFPKKQAKARIKDIVREAAIKIRELGLPQHYILKNEDNNTAILIDGDRDNYRTVSAPIAYEFITKGAQCPGAVKYTGNPSDVQLLKQVTGKSDDSSNISNAANVTAPPSPVIPPPSAPVSAPSVPKRRGRPPKTDSIQTIDREKKVQQIIDDVVKNPVISKDGNEIIFTVTDAEPDLKFTWKEYTEFRERIIEKTLKAKVPYLTIFKDTGKGMEKFSLRMYKTASINEQQYTIKMFVASVIPIKLDNSDTGYVLWNEYDEAGAAYIKTQIARYKDITKSAKEIFTIGDDSVSLISKLLNSKTIKSDAREFESSAKTITYTVPIDTNNQYDKVYSDNDIYKLHEIIVKDSLYKDYLKIEKPSVKQSYILRLVGDDNNRRLAITRFLSAVFPTVDANGGRKIRWDSTNELSLDKINSDNLGIAIRVNDVNIRSAATAIQHYLKLNAPVQNNTQDDEYANPTYPGIVDAGVPPSVYAQNIANHIQSQSNTGVSSAISVEQQKRIQKDLAYLVAASQSKRGSAKSEFIITISDILAPVMEIDEEIFRNFKQALVKKIMAWRPDYISIVKTINNANEKFILKLVGGNYPNKIAIADEIYKFFDAVIREEKIFNSKKVRVMWEVADPGKINSMGGKVLKIRDTRADAKKEFEEIDGASTSTAITQTSGNTSHPGIVDAGVPAIHSPAKTQDEYQRQLDSICKTYDYNADSREIIFYVPPIPEPKAYVHVKEIQKVHNDIVKIAKEKNVWFVSIADKSDPNKSIIDLRGADTFGDAKWRGVYTFVSNVLAAGTKVTGKKPETYMSFDIISTFVERELGKKRIKNIDHCPRNADPRNEFEPIASSTASSNTNVTGRQIDYNDPSTYSVTSDDVIRGNTEEDEEIKDEFINSVIDSITTNQGSEAKETVFIVASNSKNKRLMLLSRAEYDSLRDRIAASVLSSGDTFVSAIVDMGGGQKFMMCLDPRYNGSKNISNSSYVREQIRNFVRAVIPYSEGGNISAGYYNIKIGTVDKEALRKVDTYSGFANMTVDAAETFKMQQLGGDNKTIKPPAPSTGSTEDALKRAALDALSAMATKPSNVSVFNAPTADELPTSSANNVPALPGELQLNVGKDNVNKFIESGKQIAGRVKNMNMKKLSANLDYMKKLPGGDIRSYMKSVGSLFTGMDDTYLALVQYYKECYEATNDTKYLGAIVQASRQYGLSDNSYERLQEAIDKLQEIKNFLNTIKLS